MKLNPTEANATLSYNASDSFETTSTTGEEVTYHISPQYDENYVNFINDVDDYLKVLIGTAVDLSNDDILDLYHRAVLLAKMKENLRMNSKTEEEFIENLNKYNSSEMDYIGY